MATLQLIPERIAVACGAAVLNEREVCDLTGVSVDTLRFFRLTDAGPAYIEAQGRVRYSVEAIADWQVQRSQAHQRMMDTFGGGYLR